MLTTPLAASDTKMSGLPAARGSIKLFVAIGSRVIRAMFGGSRLVSVRPVVANCRWTDCPAEPGVPGDSAAGELPPEQPASITSAADAPSAARSSRKIAIKSDYHFLLHWFAPRKVSIVQTGEQ